MTQFSPGIGPFPVSGSNLVPVLYLFSRFVPERNRLDLAEVNLPLENLLDLTFFWTLLHLLSTNQVQELGA